jgi:hypothetical protein
LLTVARVAQAKVNTTSPHFAMEEDDDDWNDFEHQPKRSKPPSLAKPASHAAPTFKAKATPAPSNPYKPTSNPYQTSSTNHKHSSTTVTTTTAAPIPPRPKLGLSRSNSGNRHIPAVLQRLPSTQAQGVRALTVTKAGSRKGKKGKSAF